MYPTEERMVLISHNGRLLSMQVDTYICICFDTDKLHLHTYIHTYIIHTGGYQHRAAKKQWKCSNRRWGEKSRLVLYKCMNVFMYI